MNDRVIKNPDFKPEARTMKLIDRPNYQTIKYELPENKFAMVSHLGAVNYKKDGKFEPIDMTLVDHGTHWSTVKALYFPTIPKYADEWFEFRNVFEGNDHTIRVRPVAAHILGVLGGEDKVVTYANAFGEGIDLEVHVLSSRLLRRVVIRTPRTEEISFDFEMEVDGKLRYESVAREGAKKPITLKADLKGERVEFEEGRTPTIIYPMRAW